MKPDMQGSPDLGITGTKFLPNTLRGPIRPQVINQMDVRATLPMIVPLSKVSLVKVKQVPLRVIRAEEYVARKKAALLEHGGDLVCHLFGTRLQHAHSIGRERSQIRVCRM